MMTGWSDLTPELQERVAQHLSGNEVACSLRLINKAAAELFRGAARVQLSEAVPPHAFVWRWGSPAAYRNLMFKSRRRLLALTAGSGVLSNLQVAVNASGCWPTELVFTGVVDGDESAFASAAAGGHLRICEWLVDQDVLDLLIFRAVESAAGNGHIALLRWLLTRWPTAQEYAWCGAARAGRRHVCEALRADAGASFVVPLLALYGAAEGGHADLVQWLLPYVSVEEVLYLDTLLLDAARGCDLAGLQRVYDTLLSLREDGWQPLQKYGGLLLLAGLTSPTTDWRAKVDWLRARGCALNDRNTNRFGYPLPDVLQPGDRIERARLYLQLLPEGDPPRAVLSNALRLAAPELVDFALEQWPHSRLADLADVVEYLNCTAYIMERGVTRTECAFETPAQVVLTARLAAAGVPIWPTIVRAAIQTGSLQMLQWMAAGADAAGQEGAALAGERVAELEGLAGAGPEVRAAAAAAFRAALEEESGADLARIAAKAGNLKMMTWLRAHGCAWNDDVFTKAAQAGNIALLEWMAEEGCPLPTDIVFNYSSVYQYAIMNQDLAVLQCLRRLGVPWGPEELKLFELALNCGCRVEILALLLEEGCAVDWGEAREAAAALQGNAAKAVRAFIEQRAGSGFH